MTSSSATTSSLAIADTLIRDLVERYPDTMRILAPLGIDLCCGGGHPLGEALDLHCLDRPTVLAEVEQVVAQSVASEG